MTIKWHAYYESLHMATVQGKKGQILTLCAHIEKRCKVFLARFCLIENDCLPVLMVRLLCSVIFTFMQQCVDCWVMDSLAMAALICIFVRMPMSGVKQRDSYASLFVCIVEQRRAEYEAVEIWWCSANMWACCTSFSKYAVSAPPAMTNSAQPNLSYLGCWDVEET